MNALPLAVPVRRLHSLALAGALILAAGVARAEDTPEPEEPKSSPPTVVERTTTAAPTLASSPPPALTPSWRTDGSWGWFVVATSVFAGGALTSIGLTIDCDDRVSCERGASMAIWGGIGVAALGSVLGLAVVANARPKAPSPSPVAVPLRVGPKTCRADAR